MLTLDLYVKSSLFCRETMLIVYQAKLQKCKFFTPLCNFFFNWIFCFAAGWRITDTKARFLNYPVSSLSEGTSSNVNRQGSNGYFLFYMLYFLIRTLVALVATSTGVPHRAVTSRSEVFFLQLKIWFTLYGLTSHFRQWLLTLLQILLKYEFNRGQCPVLSCANGMRAIDGNIFLLLRSLVEMCLIACRPCSTEYAQHPHRYHLELVSRDEEVVYGQHIGSDNCRLEIAPPTFLCRI